MNKIKIDDQIWADIQYKLANIVVSQSFTNKKLNHPVKENTNLVYHYTTPEKFLSIINNQSFYFTHINYLNDRKEYHYGVELLISIINKIKREESSNKVLDKILDNINYIYKSSKYVSCFSCNGDMLSQWRAYANEGKGFAIGFDLEELNDYCLGHVDGKYILYDNISQEETIEELINIQLAYFESLKDTIDWGEYGYDSLVATSIIDFTDNIISNFKHPSFSEEREFRLQINVDEKISKSKDIDFGYRSSESLIIPFINLKYKNWNYRNNSEEIDFRDKLPIKEIIIGPSLEFKTNRHSINSFLHKNGYQDINIKQSNIPYRV